MKIKTGDVLISGAQETRGNVVFFFSCYYARRDHAHAGSHIHEGKQYLRAGNILFMESVGSVQY